MGLAEKLDELIMSGVNELVYSWNYLTGRTKTDLAQLLNVTAPIFEISGALVNSPILGAIVAPLIFYITYATQKDFKEQEADELRSERARAIRNPIHEYRNIYLGYGFGIGALIVLCLPEGPIPVQDEKPKNNLAAYSQGFGTALRSASFYIMRADDPPPRKNIFSRAYDYLTGRSLAHQSIRVSR